ncbi:FkbM family methyltransferase [Candidatus Marinarcus aquaticus]|uniref:FkbM family methyltransferase n=1 Tax=Candidatus Marinarcus aquaticus TaxID=2044504 RepID=UPI001D179E0F|nr:FkbM family methyltransferase [Candidatus Marinarcus aquaticus]
MNLVGFDYINEKEKRLVERFLYSSEEKKYILGINKYTKSIAKEVAIDGIIDDFTRVQSSRKKEILQIEDVPKDALILSTASGSPLEIKKSLDALGYENFNYLSLYKYGTLQLPDPMFMADFKEDFLNNKAEYEKSYHLLFDEESKRIFEKVLNFKITYDFRFMQGFTNNHEAQYFDKDIIPNIKNIRFVDGGAYVGDTLQEIIKNYPDYEKIYCIEPNNLHINIAKREFGELKNIEFINCGLSDTTTTVEQFQEAQNNCDHNYQALQTDTLDNLIKDRVDYIKLDIEGAEQAALKGAKQTILKSHPILAVCIYHQAQDWYKVPQIVLGIRADYDVYLRHYMEGIYETVLYFLPKK